MASQQTWNGTADDEPTDDPPLTTEEEIAIDILLSLSAPAQSG